MAASSNTTWLKGFSGNPDGEALEDAGLAELVRRVGRERVAYPPGGDDAVLMTKREALIRTALTRAVIDGDMTAIKLMVELFEGKSVDEAGGVQLDADQLAAAEAILKAWEAEQRAAGDAATEEAAGNDGDDR